MAIDYSTPVWRSNLTKAVSAFGSATGLFARRSAVRTAPIVKSARRVRYGPFQMEISLPKDAPFSITASTDLKNWHSIATGNSPAETLNYVDSDASDHNSRFYRIYTEDLPSPNVIGYVSVTVPPGYSLIGNPFINPTENVADLCEGWPDGASINRFDPRNYRLIENVLRNGVWSKPSDTLAPGEGVILFNPVSDYKILNLVGDVLQGTQVTPVAQGFSMRVSALPRPGRVDEDLQFPVVDGDVIHRFDAEQQKYIEHQFQGGKWLGSAPVIAAGEAFLVAKANPANWTQVSPVQD